MQVSRQLTWRLELLQVLFWLQAPLIFASPEKQAAQPACILVVVATVQRGPQAVYLLLSLCLFSQSLPALSSVG